LTFSLFSIFSFIITQLRKCQIKLAQINTTKSLKAHSTLSLRDETTCDATSRPA